MIQRRQNIFDQATQLVSLDCSSIIGQNMTSSQNLSQSINHSLHQSITHSIHQSLHQSLLNLKTVLPSFTSEFNLFKEEIIDMSYYIVNKLMNVVKAKNSEISKLKDEIDNSLLLNNGMKKEVIQLKEMITEFMESFKKQMHIKQKEISLKQNQINELKTILKQNFNSPRNFCQNCQSAINSQNNIILSTIEDTKEQKANAQKMNDFLQNYRNKQQILIEMSESIVCNTGKSSNKMSLEIIQEEGSDINSITDYLQSQRCSQKQNTSKGSTQLLNSSRTDQNKERSKDEFYNGKKFNLTQKLNIGESTSQQYLNQCDITVKDRTQMNILNIMTNFQDKRNQDTFSSRIRNTVSPGQNSSIDNQRQRRCSQQLFPSKSLYEDYKIERKPIQRGVLSNKMTQNQLNIRQGRDQSCMKTQIQQVSKSSSSSEIMHFGDTDKINVNLPKMFQTPKNMNLVKKNSSKPEPRQQRFKTEPTPRDQKFQLNKENIHIQYQQKPVEMGRKIFARKKIMMTHSKPNNTARLQSENIREKIITENSNAKHSIQPFSKKTNPIQIKFIQSPDKEPSKPSNLIKQSILTIFPTDLSEQMASRTNNCMDYSSTASNISTINQSIVKSHHIYHSTGKYQSESTPKNSSKLTMTPGKHQTRTQDRKSSSKSKEKLKVTSKCTTHDQATVQNFNSNSKKQKFVAEMNQNQLLSNNRSITKIRNKNLSVHIGSSNKMHLRQNLLQIKQALINYNMARFYTNLKEVFFDGKIVNGHKEGYGKVVYDNGMNYDGQLKQGKRSGEAKITLNGIDIYEGQFANDIIQGQGYLKFLRFFTIPSHCSKILQDSSYFGRFSNSNFDGMGTLFLNQKQKIVSKFSNGIPYGELTFYTQNDIQFAHWPSE